MTAVSTRKKIREMGADELDNLLKRLSLTEERNKSLADHQNFQTALKQYKEITGKHWKLLN